MKFKDALRSIRVTVKRENVEADDKGLWERTVLLSARV